MADGHPLTTGELCPIRELAHAEDRICMCLPHIIPNYNPGGLEGREECKFLPKHPTGVGEGNHGQALNSKQPRLLFREA